MDRASLGQILRAAQQNKLTRICRNLSKFDSAIKFIRGRQNPRLFDTNGGKIGTHLFKFTGRSCKFNKAEQDENLTQICQILSPLGRLNLNRAEPLSEHFIAKFGLINIPRVIHTVPCANEQSLSRRRYQDIDPVECAADLRFCKNRDAAG